VLVYLGDVYGPQFSVENFAELKIFALFWQTFLCRLQNSTARQNHPSFTNHRGLSFAGKLGSILLINFSY